MNDLLFHPAFQSVVFPGLLSAVGLGVLRFALPASRQRWSVVAPVLAFAASLALLPGWHWPAGSAVQKLPWILAGGLVLAVVLEAAHRSTWTHWAGAALGWALASQWLTSAWATTPAAVGTALAGAAVLACLCAQGSAAVSAAANAQDDTRQVALAGAAAAATLAVASLGLAGLVAFGGSLLLAQLAAMVATASGVLAAWGVWQGLQRGPRGPASVRGAALPAVLASMPLALMPLGLAWLALAQAAILPGIGAARIGVLALAFALPLALLGRRKRRTSDPSSAGRPSAWSPVLAALAAAVPAAAAIGWQATGPTAVGAGSPTGAQDPYYEPSWK